MHIEKWLDDEPKGVEACLDTAATILIWNIVYSISVSVSTAVLFGWSQRDQTVETTDQMVSAFQRNFVRSVEFLGLGVFLEELFFRALPIFVCFWICWIIRCRADIPKILLVICIISSALFGWLHGGWRHVLLQGGDGILYCALFLKCGGLKGSLFKPLAMTSIVHFAYDAIAITIVTMLFV